MLLSNTLRTIKCRRFSNVTHPPGELQVLYSALDEVGELYRMSPNDELIVEFLLVNWELRSFGGKTDYGQMKIDRTNRVYSIRERVNSKMVRLFREKNNNGEYSSMIHQDMMNIFGSYISRRKRDIQQSLDKSIVVREKRITELKYLLSPGRAPALPEDMMILLESASTVLSDLHNTNVSLEKIVSVEVPDRTEKIYEFLMNIPEGSPEELLLDVEKFSEKFKNRLI